MAIPWDASQHINNMAAGVAQAMPGIQAGIAQAKGAGQGSEQFERMLNLFEQRVLAGEPKENVMQDLLGQLQSSAQGAGQPLPDAGAQLHTAGVNQGQPALGSPAGLSAPISQGPNSFKPGQGLQQAAQMPSQPAPMQPPMEGPMPAQVSSAGMPSAPSAPTPSADLPSANYETGGIKVTRDAAPEAEPYAEEPKINLTRERPMSTSTDGKSPPVPSRMEQEQRFGDLKRMSEVNLKEDSAELKKTKQEQDIQVKTLKALASIKRLGQKDIADLQARISGQDQKAQLAITKMFMDAKFKEEELKVKWAAQKLKRDLAGMAGGGAAKLPPELKLAYDNYQKAAGRITALRTSDTAANDPVASTRAIIEMENTRNIYNNIAKDLAAKTGAGYPTIDITEGPLME